MTTAELERIGRGVIPQVGTTGWRMTVLETPRSGTVYAVVPILFGRLDGRPVFTGGLADCRRFYDLLEGRAPTSRRAPVNPAGPDVATTEGIAAPDQELAEAPDEDPQVPTSSAGIVGQAGSADASTRLCAGCDLPLPAGARRNRTTHDGACRVRAARRRAAAKRGRAATSGGVTVSPSSGRSGPRPATRSALEADPAGDIGHMPAPDSRGLSGSPVADDPMPTPGTQPSLAGHAAGIEGAGQQLLLLPGSG